MRYSGAFPNDERLDAEERNSNRFRVLETPDHSGSDREQKNGIRRLFPGLGGVFPSSKTATVDRNRTSG